MRILTVDNSPVARRLVRQELEEAGYTVQEASSGEPALKQFAARRPDLVTLEVNMEGMDGFETCRRIRALELQADPIGNSSVPIVFLTSKDSLAVREEGFRAGAADFITKPYAPGTVRRVVDSLLRPPPATTPLRALVVDDSPLVRRIVCQALAPLGLELLTTGDGQDALAILQDNPGAVQLVVTDYVMVRMSGDELCGRIRNTPTLSHLPVVVVSALERKEDVLAAFRAGATDYLPKPFVKEIFQCRVAALLDGLTPSATLGRRLVQLYGEGPYRQALQRFGKPADSEALTAVLDPSKAPVGPGQVGCEAPA